MSSGGVGGIDTSMYAPPQRPSPAAGAGEFATLMNTIANNKLLATSINRAQFELQRDQVKDLRNQFATLASRENPSRADAQKIIETQLDLGLITPVQAAKWQSQIPDDDEGISDWARDQGDKAMDMVERLNSLYETMTVNQGPFQTTQTRRKDTGELVGDPMVSGLGLSPAEQAARIQVVDPRDGITKGSVPAGSLANPNLLNPSLPQNPGNPLAGGGFTPDPAATLPDAPLAGGAEAPPPRDVLPGGAAMEPAPPALIDDTGFVQTEPTPGDPEIVQAWNDTAKQAGNYNQSMIPLDKAFDIAKKMPEGSTGPGAESINDLKQFFTVMGEAADQAAGTDIFSPVDIEGVQNFDELRKYLEQYVGSVAGGMGATNDMLRTLTSGNPNVTVSNAAIKDVLMTSIAAARMQQMRAVEFRDLLGTPKEDGTLYNKADWQDFAIDWNKTHSVEMYAFDLMTPEQRKAVAKKLNSDTEVSAFRDAMKKARDAGVMFTREE
jgi:hypothetical protein